MKALLTGLVLLTTTTSAIFAQTARPVPVTTGVSLELATYRQQVITDIHYDIHFQIPAEKTEAITAHETITFDLKEATQTLQLDFKQPASNISRLLVNGKTIKPVVEQEHVLIPAQYVNTGNNTVIIDFTAGDGSLNRNAEYLYALFVPDRARVVFPCFDQPDLKAKFKLVLIVPGEWKTLANGRLKSMVQKGRTPIVHNFEETDLLPTYLFSFTAGKYSQATDTLDGRPATFLYREKDPRDNIDSVFRLHKEAIRFLEEWTGIAFPFQKIGFVAIPDFQFGGMEHPGEVQYKASSLFLQNPTRDQLLARTNLISHETAHMWFGDLVTMKWFNDVWMKEVFANFMADKVAEKLQGSESFNLRFLQDHYNLAYSVDRTAGANPIRQQLDNLQDAGTMYGNIIYHKAPIMMRQIELLMGKENFQQGVREYLHKYSYSNATWNDLIAILAKYTTADLYKWNTVWVNQPGRPVFDYQLHYDGDKISQLHITQQPESGAARLWPQSFDVTLVYPDSTSSIRVNMQDQAMDIPEAAGKPRPLFIIFNGNGLGYGLFPSDPAEKSKLNRLESPINRASAYVNAYENMLANRTYAPGELLAAFTDALATEQEETNLKQLTGYISTLFWEFTKPAERSTIVAGMEKKIWDAMEKQTAPNNRKLLFKAYQDIYLTPEAGEKVFNIWQSQQAPENVKLAEEDYISLSLTIALKKGDVSVISQQQERLKDNDKKDRLTFLIPALSPDAATREQFFNSLKERKNRAKESWVAVGLSYLHHPLRQQYSRKFLPESLNMLEEIQHTGDIFFPQSWLGAIFSNYQDAAAWQVVQDFLRNNPGYNEKLKSKILQTTDNLYRAQQLLK
ncbi:M1 family aminopeptidase [Chitinophaga sp. Cy-1792]|uniref:M1 family metallopeptidase n=1 Tax=Chitinophaga sp. Cy-1792 TaxID=2608339 RepID=UPI00141F03B1|nr:M1 family aminopeptidase [Chitinophaga sp. Cy-1792]NIG54828.1 aminopeptidase [Chitinophaga sp. Cy-1792]